MTRNFMKYCMYTGVGHTFQIFKIQEVHMIIDDRSESGGADGNFIEIR